MVKRLAVSDYGCMETTQSKSAPRRTRRNAAQWHAILTHHFASDESPQELADRLGCALSTVETQMKLATSPAAPRDRSAQSDGFVEVKRPLAGEPTHDVALSLKTASGVVATFAKLPAPAYLAEALRMLG